jgi:hypothetical protein
MTGRGVFGATAVTRPLSMRQRPPAKYTVEAQQAAMRRATSGTETSIDVGVPPSGRTLSLKPGASSSIETILALVSVW